MLWYGLESMFSRLYNNCIEVTPSQSAFQLGIVENITVAVNPPLTSNKQLLSLLSGTGNQTLAKRDLLSLLQSKTNAFYCNFNGVEPVVAQPSTDFTTLECSVPKIVTETQSAFTIDFSSTPLTTPQTFSFVGKYRLLCSLAFFDCFSEKYFDRLRVNHDM